MTAVSRTARLSAAVVLGAGLLAGAAPAASAASAAPAASFLSAATSSPWSAPSVAWTAEHGTPWGTLYASPGGDDHFRLGAGAMGGYAASDIAVLARPAGADASADTAIAHGLGGNRLDLITVDEIVAAAGEGPTEVRLVVAGTVVAQAHLPSAADLRQVPHFVQGAPENGWGASFHSVSEHYGFDLWPLAQQDRISTGVMTRAGEGEYVLGNDPLVKGMTAKIATAPMHGTVRMEDGLVLYIPEAGYQGADTVTVAYTVGGTTKTITYQVTVADKSDTDMGELTWRPTMADTDDLQRPAGGKVDPTAPSETPAPSPAASTPAAPAATASAPAATASVPATHAPAASTASTAAPDASATPAPASAAVASTRDETHAVPEKVQTDAPLGWGIAGLGALAAGVLVTVRRVLATR